MKFAQEVLYQIRLRVGLPGCYGVKPVSLVQHLYHAVQETRTQVELVQNLDYICPLGVGLWVASITKVNNHVLREWERSFSDSDVLMVNRE